MSTLLTLRLDKKRRQRITQIARRRRVSTSQMIRTAIDALIEREEAAATPYEKMADLIGVVRSADPTLSTNTGRKFAELLKKRRGQS